MGLIVHHLQYSQSERVPWLCEELGIEYELKNWKRSPLLAPPELKALHPQGSAPIIQDDDVTLAESNACLEYIAHKHGGGRLFLKPSHPAYADFLYWWHWSNSTLQAGVVRSGILRTLEEDHPVRKSTNERFAMSLKLMDDRLRANEWLAGSEFTAADVMVVTSLTTMRYFFPFDLTEYEGLLGFLERVGKREAYRRAMAKSDPDMELVLGAKSPEKLFW